MVASVTRRTASSNGSSSGDDTDCTPLTLRTYWRAAASISSAVAAGCEPPQDGDVAAHAPILAAGRAEPGAVTT